MRTLIAAHELNGEVNDGVGGQLQAEELRGSAQEDGPQLALVLRQFPFDERIEHVLELTLPAQYRGCHQARQGAIARRQKPKIRLTRDIGKHVLERAALPQYAADQVGGEATRGQAFW